VNEKTLEYAQEALAEWRDPDYFCECPACDGSGNGPSFDNTLTPCPECDGEGWIEL
jgi:hypothetical protein